MSTTTTTTIGSAATQPAATDGTTPTDFSKTQKDKTGSEFGLDKDAFLKILVEQLKNQDPSSPGDSNQYVQQMTSYSMLEQLTNISQAMQVQQANSAGTTATSLVGHSVTYLDADDNEQSGVVNSVDFSTGTPTLTIGDKSGIALGQVTKVGGLAAADATSTPPSTSTPPASSTPPATDPPADTSGTADRDTQTPPTTEAPTP
jgi:flagellar basal-body rod modification protein FlgD